MSGGGDDEDKSSKTEEPSQHKINKSLEQGNVPISREVGTTVSALAALLCAVAVLPWVGGDLLTALAVLIDRADAWPAGDNDLWDVVGVIAGPLLRALGAAAGILGVFVVGSLVVARLQGNLVFSMTRVAPKLSNVSPATGLKRLFSGDALIEFAKSLVKVAVVGWAAWQVVAEDLAVFSGAVDLSPDLVVRAMSDGAVRLLLHVLVAMLVITAFDVFWKRFSWRRSLRMSLKELRDEHKETEGDPKVKARIADLRKQRARQRMAAAVPTAAVVIANPTHYAVALRYERGKDEAPVCVAKGIDLMALQIRRIAERSGVPVVENPPLARALHAVVEEDRQIPYAHWQAVAEIVGFVLAAKEGRRREPPPGSRLAPPVDSTHKPAGR